MPTLRAMMLEFPDDPACDTLDRQYMLGDALLVAPVFRHDHVVDYYLPNGRWTHFLTGEVREGGRWQRESYDFLSLPLWVRPNSIIPVGSNENRPDYDFADGVTFHLFELADGVSVSRIVPNLQGETELMMRAHRDGNRLHLEVTGATKPWSALLRGIEEVTAVTNGTATVTDRGVLLQPDKNTAQLTVQLSW